MDYRQIALEVAEEVGINPWGMTDFATRFLAAIADKAEPVAEVLGRDADDERTGPWFWVYDATRIAALPDGTKLFLHPAIESAPQQEPLHVGDSQFESWYSTYYSASLRNGSKQIARDAYAAGMGDPLVSHVGAAPLPDEVAQMVKYLYSIDEHIAADMIERLARQVQDNADDLTVAYMAGASKAVPQDCVVVPKREPAEWDIAGDNDFNRGWNACREAMIAAGEVKP